MKLSEALKIVEQLQTLNELLKPENGNLRWDYLQSWLRDNPEWEEKVTHYEAITADEALADLRRYICLRADLSPMLLKTLIRAHIEQQAKVTIETIQTLYRERKEMDTPIKKPKKRGKKLAKSTNKRKG